MEKFKLSDILEICVDFKNDPTEENHKRIQNMLSQFEVRQYLPLINKELAVISVLSCVSDSMDAIDAEMNYVAGKVVFGLMQYVINIEVDLQFGMIPLSIIDALYEFEIVDYILQFCEKDYSRLEKMMDEAINFSNMDRICHVPSLLSDDKLEEFTKSLKEFKEELSPEVLEAVKALSSETSPEWRVTRDILGELMVSNSFDKDLELLDNNKDEDEEEEEEESQEDEEIKTA